MGNGVGGMATGGATPTLMLSSLAILVFRGGGAGAGAHGPAGALPITDTAIPTAIMDTAMGIPATDTVTTVTVTATVIVTGPVTAKVANTALLLGQESLSYSADFPARVIITDQSMESWGLRHGEQSGPTRRSTVT
jgi:hypothetical protein